MFGGILLGLCIASVFIGMSNVDARFDTPQTKFIKVWIRMACYAVFFPSLTGFIGWVLELIL